MSARGFSGKEEEGDSVNSMDTEAYLQEQLDAARIEEAAEIAEMSPEELFYSRHGILALADREEQDKLDEELEKLAEELKEQRRKEANDRRSGVQKNRQAFARQAFKETANDDDEFGGGKKRTIRKKNRKGTRTRTTIRKRQRKNRTRTMRKKARKSRNSRKSNKAR
jgi:hypothetical protein